MSNKAKKPYVAKAEAAKKEHAKAMAIYNKKKAAGQTQKAPRRKRDKTKPRRAMSAYLFFGRDHREQVKASFKEERPPVTQVMTKLAEMWRAFPDSKKKKYNVLAAKAKAEAEAKAAAGKKKLESDRPQGVEVDANDKPVAYHLYKNHPYDKTYNNQNAYIRVPADEIIHAYLPTRAEQTRPNDVNPTNFFNTNVGSIKTSNKENPKNRYHLYSLLKMSALL